MKFEIEEIKVITTLINIEADNASEAQKKIENGEGVSMKIKEQTTKEVRQVMATPSNSRPQGSPVTFQRPPIKK